MERKDFVFISSCITEVFDKNGLYLGEIEGVSASDIRDMNDEDFNLMMIDNGIKM